MKSINENIGVSSSAEANRGVLQKVDVGGWVRESWLSVLVVVMATLLTYAPLIRQLGFYRDDWYLLWTSESEGSNGLLKLFAGDRPFLGWIYIFDFKILGSNPLGWHVYALLLKIVSAMALLWLIREIWPARKVESVFFVLLFVVYPGFYQQPNALTFKQLLLAYAASLLSLACTFYAIRADRRTRRVLSAVLSAILFIFYIFIYEALVGMEAVRLLLIWYYYYRQTYKWKESLRSAAKWFVPYFLLSFLFVVWRVFIFQSTRRATSIDVLALNYKSLHGFIQLPVETFKDIIESTILAWGVPFYQFTVSARYGDLGFAFVVAFLVIALSGAYYFFSQKRIKLIESEQKTDSMLDWLILGLCITVVTTLPIIAAGRNVLFGIQWDRYTYQSSMGVAMLISGFVFYGLRGRLRLLVLMLLIMSGVATQILSAQFYRDFWEMERAAWWQLYWRAPQIADGTTVIASLPGAYQLAEEYEVWGPLNLFFQRGKPLMYSGQITYQNLPVDIKRGLQEERLVRGTILVNRNYGQSLVISIPAYNSCLHVYHGVLGLPLNEHPLITMTAPYSRNDWIQVNANSPVPPEDIFGEEPAHNWCFYYQKINLALQSGDWSDAARISDEAISRDFRPEDDTEWLPVLFAYANSGQPKKLKQTSKFIDDKYTRWYLCDQLKSSADWRNGDKPELVFENLCTYQ